MKFTLPPLCKRAATIAAPAVLVLTLTYFYVFHRAFDDDEFQHAHIAWLLWNGQVPYVDFFEHHLPLYHLLLAPLFAFPGGVWQLFALRFMSALCWLGSVGLTYRLARRANCDAAPAAAAAALLALVPMFAFKMFEARPGALGLPFFMGAIALIPLKPLAGRGGAARFLAAGLLAGAMVLISQKYTFAVCGLTVGLLLLHGLRPTLWLILGGALTAAAMLLWLWANGALLAAYEHVILLNLHWKRTFSPAGYCADLFLTSGAFLALGAAGLLKPLLAPPPQTETKETNDFSERRIALYFLALLSGGLLGILLVPVPFRQVFLPIFPILALGAARLLHELHTTLRDVAGYRLAATILLLAALLPGLRTIGAELQYTNAADLETLRHIEELSPPNAPVFDGRGLAFYRPHIGRHACMHEGIFMMLDAEKYTNETLDALQAAQLPLVIVDYRVRKMPPRILDAITSSYLQLKDSDIHLPGFSVDRAKLGRTSRPQQIQVALGGEYHVRWRGGTVRLDDKPLTNGVKVKLKAGDHKIAARGFVQDLEFRLVKPE